MKITGMDTVGNWHFDGKASQEEEIADVLRSFIGYYKGYPSGYEHLSKDVVKEMLKFKEEISITHHKKVHVGGIVKFTVSLPEELYEFLVDAATKNNLYKEYIYT